METTKTARTKMNIKIKTRTNRSLYSSGHAALAVCHHHINSSTIALHEELTLFKNSVLAESTSDVSWWARVLFFVLTFCWSRVNFSCILIFSVYSFLYSSLASSKFFNKVMLTSWKKKKLISIWGNNWKEDIIVISSYNLNEGNQRLQTWRSLN